MKIAHGLLALSVCTSVFLLLSIFDSLAQNAQAASGLSFNPKISQVDIDFGPQDYKSQRLRQMAQIWKGTVLEKHTVPLLSMLLQEDGTLTAERRHDCHKGVCYGIGFMGHSISSRGTPLIYVREGQPQKYYRTWKVVNGKKLNPQQQFERDYPKFSSEWTEQFREYTLRMTECIDSGTSVKGCIQGWNSLEKGRLAKVNKHKAMVLAAI